MSKKWRTIALPTEIIEEIRLHMKGYTSLSEFVRAAIRHYIDERCTPITEEVLEEVAPIE